MNFTNPIEEIYKCSILKEGDNGGVPKCLYVFYGSVKGVDSPPTSKQLTHLYQEYIDNGSNSEVFENVFSKIELKNISRYKIKIRFVNFKIYSDDTIDVVKRKIMETSRIRHTRLMNCIYFQKLRYYSIQMMFIKNCRMREMVTRATNSRLF